MQESGKRGEQIQPQQTMEQMQGVLANGLGPEIPTELTHSHTRERVVSVSMPEGGSYVRRETDDSLGRPSHLENGTAVTLDDKTQAAEVVQGQLGCRIVHSYNQSGTTDILTLAATPHEVSGRVQQAESDPNRNGVAESTAHILGTTEINGASIADIEGGFLRQGGGFVMANNRLGRDESLVHRLAEDNELVVTAGFSHQQLAEPLSFMLGQFSSGSRAPGQSVEYNGSTYRLEGDVARGFDTSALSGEQNTTMIVRVVNAETGAALQFDSLSPTEIGRYGFYGGTDAGVTRRVSPGAVATVFDLQPQNG